MAFERLEPLKSKDVHIGCLNCSTVQFPKASMRTRIWGEIEEIRRDGEIVYSAQFNDVPYNDAPTLMMFENMARKDPDADWRYYRMTALHDEEYQRQDKNYWPIVKSGNGYA